MTKSHWVSSARYLHGLPIVGIDVGYLGKLCLANVLFGSSVRLRPAPQRIAPACCMSTIVCSSPALCLSLRFPLRPTSGSPDWSDGAGVLPQIGQSTQYSRLGKICIG